MPIRGRDTRPPCIGKIRKQNMPTRGIIENKIPNAYIQLPNIIPRLRSHVAFEELTTPTSFRISTFSRKSPQHRVKFKLNERYVIYCSPKARYTKLIGFSTRKINLT